MSQYNPSFDWPTFGAIRAKHRAVQSTDQLVHRIVQSARSVHTTLGPGFIESIYSRALAAELKNEEFRVEREKLIKIWYRSLLVGKHCLDIVVNDAVILELKASRGIVPAHTAQMKSYLHASHFSLGLILNFGLPELEFELIREASGHAEE